MRDATAGTVAANDFTTTAAATETSESEIFDFNSFPDIPIMTSGIDTFSEATNEAIAANLDGLIPGDGVLDTEMDTEMATLDAETATQDTSADHPYYAEYNRQERLEAEFVTLFGSDVHPEVLAFCDRADESATLPSLFSGVF